MHDSKSRTSLQLLVVALAVLLTPRLSGAQDEKWLVRAVGHWETFSSPTEIPSDDDDDVRVGAENIFDVGIEGEYRINRGLGIELGMLYGQPEVRVHVDFADGRRAILADGMKFRLITAGPVFHITPERRVDLTLTPLVGYAFFTNLRFEFQGESAALDVESDFIKGARLAANIPLGESRWALSFAARYLDAAVEGTDPNGERFTFDLDPIILNAGIAIRF